MWRTERRVDAAMVQNKTSLTMIVCGMRGRFDLSFDPRYGSCWFVIYPSVVYATSDVPRARSMDGHIAAGCTS